MNSKRIVFGIGIVLAVLAVLTTTATADNVVYFDPDPSCAVSGETITVTMWLNATDGCGAIEGDIYFDLDVVNITSGTPGDFPLMWGFVHYGHFVRYGGWSPTGLNISGHLKMADFTLVANNSGTSVLNNNENNNMGDQYGHILPDQVWMNGTFNCPCGPQTYTISGYTDPAADTVEITNLNKPSVVDDRPADYIGPDGFYNLTLNVMDEIEAGNMLQITACEELGEYGSNCNVSIHTV